MSPDYPQKIIDTLNSLLNNRVKPRISLSNCLFAKDEDINYGEIWSIHSSKLIPPDQFHEVIAPTLENGPSWIHANLISALNNKSIITLTFGANVGNPNPHINVSFELDKTVNVIN